MSTEIKETKAKESYVKATVRELKQVTWPTKRELFSKTSIVLSVVIISTLLVWIIDTLLSGALGFLVK